ncbi:hypothetical protein D3C81_2149670 [compost metagenome]
MLMLGGGAAGSPIVYNPWYTSNIFFVDVTETPTVTSYIQKDGWLNSAITANTIVEQPAPAQYFYMPSNNWLLTDSIATPQVVELQAPTSYLQATP